jgi:hypothetical protein
MSDPWLKKEDGLWMNSPQEQGQEGWKHLWKVQSSPKTKYLLWRVCKDCLPTRERLHERVAAWQNAGLFACLQPWLQRCSTVKEVLFDICCHEEKEMAGKIAMLIWVIWNNRNNCVWNGEKEVGQQLGYKALHLWEEWRAAQNMRNQATQTVMVQQKTQWHKNQASVGLNVT